MSILLLIVIYLIFISLGLPDSILGSSFPAIATNLHIREDMAGYIGLVISGCTIISSFFSERLIRKFTTKYVVSVSILLTATGLVMFSLVKADFPWAFFPIAILLGLGAGAIDSALNNYVALHYKAIHMNWLHCSWGIGASLSPLIVAPFIDSSNGSSGWNKGVFVIAMIQFTIALIAFASFPLWGKVSSGELQREEHEEKEEEFSKKSLLGNPIFYLALFGFFCYCALETTTGNWAGFFFHKGKGFDTKSAARLDSMFYIGITVGRFISGPLSLKIKEKNMMRIGESILLLGTLLACIPFYDFFAIAGILLVGLGCAPIYPAIIRSTPYRFSRRASQHVMGLQMAVAYCGNIVVSPLYGLIANKADCFSALPYVALVFALLMLVSHEIINHMIDRRDRSLSEEEKRKYYLS